MENKDRATGFPCYPGGNPRYCRCSFWLPGPSAQSQCWYRLTPGKMWMASESLAAKRPGREHRFAYSAQAAGFLQARSRGAILLLPSLAHGCRARVPVSTGDRRSGMEGCAGSGAEGSNLYPGHCGFAAQHVHHTHNHGVPWCLPHPRDTPRCPTAWGSTSPEPHFPNQGDCSQPQLLAAGCS